MNHAAKKLVLLFAIAAIGAAVYATTGVDPHAGQASSMLGPYSLSAAVTTSDSNELPNYSSALYVGVAGDVKVTTIGGSVVVFKAAPVGVLPVRAKLVWATGTTATNILALY